jgi:protocatechuate 3,4-dioxygenase, alpha subunit
VSRVANPRVPTPSQTVGPFFGFALPFPAGPNAVVPETPGARRLEGQVLDGAGQPVSDCLVELWQGDQFARCSTDAEGAFHFYLRKPEAIRQSGGRVRAPHMNVTVLARGLLRHLATFVYFPDEGEANQADPVLALLEPGIRETLIARSDGEVLRFDIRLQGDGETAFFSLGRPANL